jgi:hypothetical protein
MHDTAGHNAAKKAALEARTWMLPQTDAASVAAGLTRLPPTPCNNADVGHGGATKPRRKVHRAAPYQAGCRHGLGRGTQAFDPNTKDEVRQLNGSLLNCGLVTRNECETFLQFACDLKL